MSYLITSTHFTVQFNVNRSLAFHNAWNDKTGTRHQLGYVLLLGSSVSAACMPAVLSKWYAWSMLARRSDSVWTMWSINWMVFDRTAFHCCISVSCSCCCWSSSAAHSALVSGTSSFLQFSNTCHAFCHTILIQHQFIPYNEFLVLPFLWMSLANYGMYGSRWSSKPNWVITLL